MLVEWSPWFALASWLAVALTSAKLRSTRQRRQMRHALPLEWQRAILRFSSSATQTPLPRTQRSAAASARRTWRG